MNPESSINKSWLSEDSDAGKSGTVVAAVSSSLSGISNKSGFASENAMICLKKKIIEVRLKDHSMMKGRTKSKYTEKGYVLPTSRQCSNEVFHQYDKGWRMNHQYL